MIARVRFTRAAVILTSCSQVDRRQVEFHLKGGLSSCHVMSCLVRSRRGARGLAGRGRVGLAGLASLASLVGTGSGAGRGAGERSVSTGERSSAAGGGVDGWGRMRRRAVSGSREEAVGGRVGRAQRGGRWAGRQVWFGRAGRGGAGRGLVDFGRVVAEAEMGGWRPGRGVGEGGGEAGAAKSAAGWQAGRAGQACGAAEADGGLEGGRWSRRAGSGLGRQAYSTRQVEGREAEHGMEGSRPGWRPEG